MTIGYKSRRQLPADDFRLAGGLYVKKIISVRLAVIIIAGMLCLLGGNLLWQRCDQYNRIEDEAENLFSLLETAMQKTTAQENTVQENTVQENSADSGGIPENDSLPKARIAARIINDDPGSIDSAEGVTEILELLNAQELHIFNSSGILVAGSSWRNFDKSFDELPGLEGFSPMTDDPSMEKTADAPKGLVTNEPISYTGVWLDNGEDIIVLGVKPAEKPAEIPAAVPAEAEDRTDEDIALHFRLLGNESYSDVYALDPGTFKITVSSRDGMKDRDVQELGCGADAFREESGRLKLSIDGSPYHGIYKKTDSVILLCAFSKSYINEYIKSSCGVITVLLLLFSAAVVVVIIQFIDKNIVRNISAINNQLVRITQGDLAADLPACGTPEFDEMCSHINEMMNTLLDNTRKMSLVFDETELPICVYELGPGMRRVVATNRIGEILHMTQEEVMMILSDSTMFLEKLNEIEENPLYPGSKIYRLPGSKNNYVRMEAFLSDRYLMGVLIDETKSILERQVIERERDIDQLTDLYSRRAFYGRVQELLEDSGTLGLALLMMVDADGLKGVNDLHGHESGDRYLQAVADILRSCGAKHCIVGRRSGDEFVLFVYGCTSIDELNNDISLVLRRRDKTSIVLYDGTKVPVRFSVGLAYYPIDGKDFNTLLHIADERMYDEKKQREK